MSATREVRVPPRRSVLILSLMVAATSGCGIQLDEAGLACQDQPAPGEILGDREVPDIQGMTGEAAAAALERADIQSTWRYYYATEPDRRTGYSECWCIPPPDSVVDSVSAAPNEQLIVMVSRSEPMLGGRLNRSSGGAAMPDRRSATVIVIGASRVGLRVNGRPVARA